MKRLVLTEIARSDLASIHRHSTRSWGVDRTHEYIESLRDTMKSLVRGTALSRARDDLRPGVRMATSGRHVIFFETNASHILVVRVLHDRMDYRRHLGNADADANE